MQTAVEAELSQQTYMDTARIALRALRILAIVCCSEPNMMNQWCSDRPLRQALLAFLDDGSLSDRADQWSVRVHDILCRDKETKANALIILKELTSGSQSTGLDSAEACELVDVVLASSLNLDTEAIKIGSSVLLTQLLAHPQMIQMLTTTAPAAILLLVQLSLKSKDQQFQHLVLQIIILALNTRLTSPSAHHSHDGESDNMFHNPDVRTLILTNEQHSSSVANQFAASIASQKLDLIYSTNKNAAAATTDPEDQESTKQKIPLKRFPKGRKIISSIPSRLKRGGQKPASNCNELEGTADLQKAPSPDTQQADPQQVKLDDWITINTPGGKVQNEEDTLTAARDGEKISHEQTPTPPGVPNDGKQSPSSIESIRRKMRELFARPHKISTPKPQLDFEETRLNEKFDPPQCQCTYCERALAESQKASLQNIHSPPLLEAAGDQEVIDEQPDEDAHLFSPQSPFEDQPNPSSECSPYDYDQQTPDSNDHSG